MLNTYEMVCTHCPLEVWTKRVTKVDVAGHTQFSANMAYLNSSSHTTWSVEMQRLKDSESSFIWYIITGKMQKCVQSSFTYLQT